MIKTSRVFEGALIINTRLNAREQKAHALTALTKMEERVRSSRGGHPRAFTSATGSLSLLVIYLLLGVALVHVVCGQPTTGAPTSDGLREKFLSCGSSESICDLQSAIEATQGNLTIILASNVTLDETLRITGRQVTIWGALNAGFRPEISGGGDYRIFFVDGNARLRLRHLQLREGLATDPKGGGAVLLRPGSSLIAEDVVFLGNRATAGDGGAILADDASVVLHQTKFSGNRAAMGDGGAIAAFNGYLQATEANFSENTAFFSGGGVRTARSVFVVANSSFIANTARSGGACSFSETITGVVDTSYFERNDAAYGGAIHDSNNKLSITNALFKGNMAWDSTSQAIYVLRETSSVNGALALVNITLIDQAPSQFVNVISLTSSTLFNRYSPAVGCIANKTSTLYPGLCASCVDSLQLPAPHQALRCACSATNDIQLGYSEAKTVVNLSSILKFPFYCRGRIRVDSLFPPTCVTNGGYVADGGSCLLPATAGKPAAQYSGCLSVTADLPFTKEKLTARPGNAGDDFWCPTVAKYSVADETKKLWGYCGLECGYASFDLDESLVPTVSPTRAMTSFPSKSPTEYEYEGYYPFFPRMFFASYVGYYGSYLEVNFDCETDCGGSCDLALPCSYYFEEAAYSWVCRWTSPRTLTIFQSGAVFRLTLVPTNSIKCDWNTHLAKFAKGSIKVTGYQYIAAPNVVLVAPTVISRCASKDLVIDGTGSRVLSAGGIAWLKWELRWVEPQLDMYWRDIQALNNILDACSAAGKLFCATDILPYDGRYAFALTIANAFGTTASAALIVEVEVESAPIVVRFSAGNLVQARFIGDSNPNLFTPLEASVKVRDACTGATVSNRNSSFLDFSDYVGPLRLSWKLIGPRELINSHSTEAALSPTADPFVVNFVPANLYLGPRHTLPYDVTVRLSAYLDNPRNPGDRSSWTYSDLVVRVVETPIVLEIRNANRTLADSETSLLVTGQVTSGGRFSQEHIEYQWTCMMSLSSTNVSNLSCPGLSPSVVNLSMPYQTQVYLNELHPSAKYTFTLTAVGSRIDRTATVSAFFKVPSAKAPGNDTSEDLGDLKPSVHIIRRDSVPSFSSSESKNRMNRDRTMRVRGSCPRNGSLNWTLTETGFKRDITNLLHWVPSAVIAPAGALMDGRYTLTLTCAGVSAEEGQVLFAVNKEPRGGSIVVNPSSGSVFTTMFTMRGIGWVDDEGDLPLRYLFETVSYARSASDTLVSRSLAPLSAWATWESRLPLGTVAVRNRAVDALGAVSGYVEQAVNVSLPSNYNGFNEWYVSACQRWSSDLEFNTRSGVDVLSEIAVSVRPLEFMFPLRQKDSDQDILVSVLALAMMHVALKNLGNMVLDDDLSEDAREEMLGFVLQELLEFLPSKQAVRELVEGLVNGEAGTELTPRGARAAFEASMSPLHRTTLVESEIEISCDVVNAIRNGTMPLAQVPDAILKTEASELAQLALGCVSLPTASPSAVPSSTSFPSSSPTLATRSPTSPKPTPRPTPRPTPKPTQARSNPTPKPTQARSNPTSKPTKLSSRNLVIRRTVAPTPAQIENTTYLESLVSWDDWAPVLNSLQRITDASLSGTIPGEDPLLLQTDKSTFQAWRLASESNKSSVLRIPSENVLIQLEGDQDIFMDNDDVWIVAVRNALNDSQSSSPSVSPSNVPSSFPSSALSSSPSLMPSLAPVSLLTNPPSSVPSIRPTASPTFSPSQRTSSPSIATQIPTFSPTLRTTKPSFSPSQATRVPSSAPTRGTNKPSITPTQGTRGPSVSPSQSITNAPSSLSPSAAPSFTPSAVPSALPSTRPTTTPAAHDDDDNDKGDWRSLQAIDEYEYESQRESASTRNQTILASDSILCFGGSPWSRWERIRAKGLRFALGSNVTFVNLSSDGLSIVVDFSPFNVSLLQGNSTKARAVVSCVRIALAQASVCQAELGNGVGQFDCVCGLRGSKNGSTSTGRRMEAQVLSNNNNLLFLASAAISLPIDDFPFPTDPPFGGPPTTESPTNFGDTRRPTPSPSKSPIVPLLTIIPQQENQAWVSVLTILSVCLYCALIGLAGMFLDRRDEKRLNKALILRKTLNMLRLHRGARNFFGKMRFAMENNIFLVTDELASRNRQAGEEYSIQKSGTFKETPLNSFPVRLPHAFKAENRTWWRIAFFKRHAWLAPLLGPFSAVSPRTSRVVLVFAIACGNMGICCALLFAGWSNVMVTGLVSALCVFIVCVSVDFISALIFRPKPLQKKDNIQTVPKEQPEPVPEPFHPQLPQEMRLNSLPASTPLPNFPSSASTNTNLNTDSPQSQRRVRIIKRRALSIEETQMDLPELAISDDVEAEAESNRSWQDPSVHLKEELSLRLEIPSGPPGMIEEPFASWKSTPASAMPSSPRRMRRVSKTPLNLDVDLSLTKPDPLKQANLDTKRTQLQHRATSGAIVMRKIPLALIGWAGAGFTVAFNGSAAGLDRFYPFIESWALALAIDFIFLQSLWAWIRVYAGFRKQLRKRQEQSGVSDSEASQLRMVRMETVPELWFRWQARAMPGQQVDELPFRWHARSGADDELQLLDAIAEVASVDTDTEARDLLDLILGVSPTEQDPQQQQELKDVNDSVAQNQWSTQQNQEEIEHFNFQTEATGWSSGSSSSHGQPKIPLTSNSQNDSNILTLFHQSPLRGSQQTNQYQSPQKYPQQPIELDEFEEGDEEASGTLEGNVLSVVEPSERIREETIV